ncbi:tyrosine-type recombinase/integrase (plasmid) [Citrobacter sp. TSA-1]|nr:tyrosine-type recombinase/integrase [Citrobacter sp. TSA-1]
MSALLHYVPDLERKTLFPSLWNTGARINEVLALSRSDFSLGAAISVCTVGHAQTTD